MSRLSRLLRKGINSSANNNRSNYYADHSFIDVSDETLRQYRARQSLLAHSEALVDWGCIESRSQPLRDGYLQMQNADGSWLDVRVIVTSSKVSILRLTAQVKLLDATVQKLKTEAERQVVITKTPNEPLGISIKGGQDLELPILISEIKEGGPVDRSKACFVGDEIVQINGINIQQLQHNDAASILHSLIGESRIALCVRFFPAARHRLVSEYLRTGDPTSLDERTTEWHEVLSIPIDCASVTHFQTALAEPRPLNAFSIRAACDTKKSVILRPAHGQESQMREWLDVIRHVRDSYPCPQLRKANPPLNFSGLVLRVGRVHERLANGRWRDFFMVLTDYDVGFHSALPSTSQQLENAAVSYPLLALRYVSGFRNPDTDGQPLDAREREEGCFFVRLPKGVRHYFSAGSVENERRWANLFRERTDNAVRLMDSITYSAYYNGDDVAFTINWQTGLWLNYDTRGNKALIWHHTFVHLKHTNDDIPNKVLTLDFGAHGGVQQLQIENPSLVVFVLANFISCHVRTREAIRVAGLSNG